VIHIANNIAIQQTVLAGNLNLLNNRPTTVWHKENLAFLADLSKTLLAIDNVRDLPDIVSFAFWARSANLRRLKNQFSGADDSRRMGLGLTFHICPSNTPINTAFTLTFGLLAGNTCVLRLPSENTPTTDYLVSAINSVLEKPEHSTLKESIMLIRYGHNDDVTAFWMTLADGRIMWGGDATIQKMRQFNTKPRSRELVFSDRYSCSLIEASSILSLGDDAFNSLTRNLYNDIYTMDQAACSSPQLVAWTGNASDVCKAQDKLWPAVAAYAEQHYTAHPAQIMDKFVSACNSAITNPKLDRITRYENTLYCLQQHTLNNNQDHYRGFSGTVHEIALSSLEQLASIITQSYQTLTYFGHDPVEIFDFIRLNCLSGIDRIVPIGQALEMDFIWDGHHMITSLSRIIDVR